MVGIPWTIDRLDMQKDDFLRNHLFPQRFKHRPILGRFPLETGAALRRIPGGRLRVGRAGRIGFKTAAQFQVQGLVSPKSMFRGRPRSCRLSPRRL